MNASEMTPALVGREVLDAAGDRIGRLDRLYLDDDGTSFFGAVAMLRRGRRRLVFVPLIDAKVSPASVTLRCGSQLARRAPQVRPGRPFPIELEADLYRHFELTYVALPGGSARLHEVT